MLCARPEGDQARWGGWTRANGFIQLVVREQGTEPVLCFDYVLCTSAPTQGCDRGDRVDDRVSDNNKYSRAVRVREGTQGKYDAGRAQV